MFGQVQYRLDRVGPHDAAAHAAGQPVASFEEQVEAVHKLISQGKVWYIDACYR